MVYHATTPNYPSLYPNDTNRIWVFRNLNQDKSIFVEPVDFDVS